MKESELREKIITLYNQFPAILSDYKSNYQLYYNDTKDQTKLNSYYNSKSQVGKCIRDMTYITYMLEMINYEFPIVTKQLNALITIEKNKNIYLKNKIANMTNVNNGSVILVSDYKENYNETNMRNWAMFAGILAICISFLKIFIIPDSAEAMLLIKEKTINEAKALLDKTLSLAKELDTKRFISKAREEKQKTELELQKRIKAEELKMEAAARAKLNIKMREEKEA